MAVELGQPPSGQGTPVSGPASAPASTSMTQRPLIHVAAPVHAYVEPQPPQLLLSIVKSTQPPSHSDWGLKHKAPVSPGPPLLELPPSALPLLDPAELPELLPERPPSTWIAPEPSPTVLSATDPLSSPSVTSWKPHRLAQLARNGNATATTTRAGPRTLVGGRARSWGWSLVLDMLPRGFRAPRTTPDATANGGAGRTIFTTPVCMKGSGQREGVIPLGPVATTS